MGTSRPLGPEQRHHQFVPVPTAEKRAAPCDALGLKADSLISPTSAGIFREYAEPNSMCFGILENGLNEFREQRLAVAPAWLGNDHAFYVGHAFGRCPIANDGEANRLRSEPGDEVGVPPVSKRVAMLDFAPAADKLLESRKPLGRHHESNILVATANEVQSICSQFVPRCELSRLNGRTLLQPTTLID